MHYDDIEGRSSYAFVFCAENGLDERTSNDGVKINDFKRIRHTW